jgi:hypothetical protein
MSALPLMIIMQTLSILPTFQLIIIISPLFSYFIHCLGNTAYGQLTDDIVTNLE